MIRLHFDSHCLQAGAPKQQVTCSSLAAVPAEPCSYGDDCIPRPGISPLHTGSKCIAGNVDSARDWEVFTVRGDIFLASRVIRDCRHPSVQPILDDAAKLGIIEGLAEYAWVCQVLME